jgi:hypothetical protein
MVSEELRAMIPDYVRGLLSPAEAKEVESALESSPEIYPEFEAAQSYYAALNQIPEVKAPTDFIDRVNRRIDSVPLLPRLRALLFEPLAVKLPFELAGVAACLVVALVLFNPFSSRGRLPAEKPVAAAVRKAVVPEESRAAETTVPAVQTEPASVAVAAAPAPEGPAEILSPEPPPLPAPKQAEVAFAKPPAPQPDPVATAALKSKAATKELPAPEKQADVKQDMTAAAAAPQRSAIPSLDAIPTLPSVAMAAPAPRAAAAPREEAPAAEAEEPGAAASRAPVQALVAPKARASSPAEDIGTVDLAPEDGSLSSATPETAETILSTTAVTCTRTMKDGKTAFLCKLPPNRLDLLIESLSRSFAVTTHLFPYDAATTGMVAVTFIIQ